MSDEKESGLVLWEKYQARGRRISRLIEDLSTAHAIIKSRDLTITQLRDRLDERANKKELE